MSVEHLGYCLLLGSFYNKKRTNVNCKWSIKWKTWQFSFSGHSGVVRQPTRLEQWYHNMEKYRRETTLADQEDPKAPSARSKWGHRVSQTTKTDRTNLGRSESQR